MFEQEAKEARRVRGEDQLLYDSDDSSDDDENDDMSADMAALLLRGTTRLMRTCS